MATEATNASETTTADKGDRSRSSGEGNGRSSHGHRRLSGDNRLHLLLNGEDLLADEPSRYDDLI